MYVNSFIILAFVFILFCHSRGGGNLGEVSLDIILIKFISCHSDWNE